MNAPSQAAPTKLTVVWGDDAMSAKLPLPADAPADAISIDACCQCLTEAHVEVTDEVKLQVTAGVNRWVDQPQELVIELRGKPAVHGEDGRMEWEPDCDLAHQTEATEGQQVDYYNRRTYIVVQEHQRIGRLVPPTPGEPGVDLRGKRLAPMAGKPADIKPDDSILVDASGTLTALRTGVLCVEGRLLKILPCLRIDGYVDFHSGNINFDGDVEILKGIRDQFIVSATGHVRVHGLIEAATLKVGRDLHALGGMAAKGKNLIVVKGDVHARYLDNVNGRITGSAIVEREVINCELDINGRLVIRSGGLLGGRTRVAGSVDVLSLGAPSGDKTIIELATIREIDELLAKTEQAYDALKKQVDKVLEELAQLKHNKATTAALREQMTELMFTQNELDQRMQSLDAKRRQLHGFIDKRCRADLRIHRAIEPGTIIQCYGQVAKFGSPVKGPLWIGCDRRKRSIVWRVGDQDPLQPISKIATVRTVD